MKTILNFAITALIVLLISRIFPNQIHIDSFIWAVGLAVVLAALNYIVRPILIFLTLPATLITFGLFLLVINAVIILLADYLLNEHFTVKNFWWALLFSLLLSFGQSFLLIKNDDEKKRRY